MARKEKKYHFIYKTTNLLNGKYYIGMHSTDNLNDGYMGSGKRLRYSINKHGVENHKKEVLEFFEDRKKLAIREREIITLNEIAKEECLNLCVGGEGGRGFTSEEQKINALKSHKKQKHLRETNKEWKEKNIEAKSKSMKRQYEKGVRDRKTVLDWTGLNHSEETKKIMSELKKGKGLGSENSQFGTCWITIEGNSKKIKKEELEIYIKQGWNKGRK